MSLTQEEKRLITLALDRLFQPGTITGTLDDITQIVVTAQSIRAKLAETKEIEGD